MDNYKERFFIEYEETKARYDKLHKIIVKYTANKLDFKLKLIGIYSIFYRYSFCV